MIQITDKIRIDLRQHPIRKELLAELTYKNPEYYQKMNMGISVYKTPKEIRTYELDPGHTQLTIMRGEFHKLRPYIYGIGVEGSHPDHPVKLQYINNDFELDQYQQGAVAAIAGRKQGVIHAVTSAGKSLIILKAIVELGQRALIVVHRKVLMEQFLADIKKYIRDEKGAPIEPGIIGGGKSSVGAITVAIDKSLSKNLHRLREEFGTTILDECHLAPAQTIFSLINSINSRNRFGFSGTLERKDQKQFLIFSTFGPVAYTIGEETLLELGRVVPVEVKVIESTTEVQLTEEEDESPTKRYRAIEKGLAYDYNRQNIIVNLVYNMPGKTIVLSNLVEPCYQMRELFIKRFGLGQKVGVITGRDSKEALESYNQMKNHDLKIIFATVGCVSTGVSISDLDNIVLVSPIYNNKLLLKQIKGRLMRTAEGKTHGNFYFIYDPYVFPESKLRKLINLINL